MLEAVLVPVKMGFGSFVELVGPAGIGKTRIVEEISDRAGELPVAATACEQYEATTPYFAFARLLRSLLGIELGADAERNSIALTERLEPHSPELVEWIPLLGDVLDAPVLSTPQVDELQPAFEMARARHPRNDSFVPIYEVRAAVCSKLAINDPVFDASFTEFLPGRRRPDDLVAVVPSRLLRKTDYPEGRFTNVFVGYDDESRAAVLELTHNWDTKSYELGTGYGHVAVEVDDANKACEEVKKRGGRVTREATDRGTLSRAALLSSDFNPFPVVHERRIASPAVDPC